MSRQPLTHAASSLIHIHKPCFKLFKVIQYKYAFKFSKNCEVPNCMGRCGDACGAMWSTVFTALGGRQLPRGVRGDVAHVDHRPMLMYDEYVSYLIVCRQIFQLHSSMGHIIYLSDIQKFYTLFR